MKLIILAYKTLSAVWSALKANSIGVRVMMIRNGHVVLVRHSYQDVWYLPGGGVKRGEHLEHAARREVIEEVGGQCGKLELFGAYTNVTDQKKNYVIVFKTSDFTFNENVRNFEISEVKLFPIEDLPRNVSTGSYNRIEEYTKGSRPRAGHW